VSAEAGVTIRPAARTEAADIVPLYDWLFAPPGSQPASWNPEHAAAALRALAVSGHGEVLLAEAGAETVGFCTVYLDIRSARFGQRAWVEDLAVHPGQRSRGVGKALLDAAKDWARDHGAVHLELDSAFVREDAHRFYDREEPSWTAVSFGWVL